MSDLTKADVLSIIAELEKAIENNKKAQIDHGISDKRKGKIEAYEYAISRIKATAHWIGMKLI
jgi:hypothetical protein